MSSDVEVARMHLKRCIEELVALKELKATLVMDILLLLREGKEEDDYVSDQDTLKYYADDFQKSELDGFSVFIEKKEADLKRLSLNYVSCKWQDHWKQRNA